MQRADTIASRPWRLRTPRQLLGPAQVVVGIVALFVLGNTLSPYYVFLGISVLITAMVLLGLGVVSGHAGMISLCQLTFAAVGGWVVAKLSEEGAPGGLIVWVLIGGLAAVPFGILVGLPALRLRGVHLAVVTLGFAVACDSVIGQIGFPGSDTYLPVTRPDGFVSDKDYFLLVGLFFVVIAAVLAVVTRRRVGATWRTLRFSERATAAAGYSVARSKLSAFGVSAFIAGVAGGLLAGQTGLLSQQSFAISQSLVVFVLAVMLGTQYVDGALIGGVLSVGVTEVLSQFSLDLNWAAIVFGLGAFQALASGRSASEDIRLRLLRRRKRPPRAAAPDTASDGVVGDAPTSGHALVVHGLNVRYGSVTALDGVDLAVPVGTVMGLIGPNGAGKSTLTDAVSGFVDRAEGTVTLGDTELAGLSVRARAAAGLRRTFQQDRVPPSLTVLEYLRFAAHGNADTERIDAMLGFFDGPDAHAHLSQVDVGSRRVVEVVGVLLAAPKVAILDEPAAGLGHDESVRLGRRLAEVPARFGTSILLIEHDLDLVRAACSRVAVLNFGVVIAVGPPAEVLADPAVVEAYVGEVASSA